MPFRPQVSSPSRSDKWAAAIESVLGGGGGSMVTVRNYAAVRVKSVKLSAGEKEMYFGLSAASPSSSPLSQEFRRKTEEAAIKTWSFRLSTIALYDGSEEEMHVAGGSLKRSLHDFVWVRNALVAEFPGVVVPPITSEAGAGDASVLERFVDRALGHAVLREAPVFKCFVLSPPSEFVAAQRDFIADGAPPPLLVQANALFLKGVELAKGEPTREASEEEDDVRATRSGSITLGAMSTADVREARAWLLAEHAKLDETLKACSAASLADAKAELQSRRADASILALRDAAATDGAAAHAEEGDFGAARALPGLRDALGYLSALAEAIAGREKLRRSLLAARDNHQKHVDSLAKRGQRLADAERHDLSAKQLRGQSTADSAKKAKNALSALGLRAASGVAKTAAALSSQQPDVDKAARLVARLQEKYKDVNDTLAAELAALKSDWHPKLAAVADAYLDGHDHKAHRATRAHDALQAALAAPRDDATDDD